ncbi:MAG TPA: glycosyl hydrolase family 28-related protein, partial [Nitrososphaera sp.]|nr:glycosyl hydrolase family 28-related protein [Nitrososphaera sp.]
MGQDPVVVDAIERAGIAQPPKSPSPVSSVIINVRDFGAKGDGSSDDATAINSAQKSLPDGGGTLYFPEGTYAIGGNGIVLQKSNVVFKGSEMWGSTLRRTVKAGPT